MAMITFITAFVLLRGGSAPAISPVDLRIGSGKLLEEGDEVTIQYRVTNPVKKELANSIKRGMPFTFQFGDRNSDPVVSVALGGMRVGGSRYVVLPAEMLPMGIGSIIPPRTDLTIWVHVIAAKNISGSKVESHNAERARGAMEVPRVVVRDGAART